jgi:hypothetical protein
MGEGVQITSLRALFKILRSVKLVKVNPMEKKFTVRLICLLWFFVTFFQARFLLSCTVYCAMFLYLIRRIDRRIHCNLNLLKYTSLNRPWIANNILLVSVQLFCKKTILSGTILPTELKIISVKWM